jgi:transcriptional regulator EpsA
MNSQPNDQGDRVVPNSPASAARLAAGQSHAEAIVSTLEATSQVMLRSQFFVWTQSQMQTLLPHRVLVCGAYDRLRRRVLFTVLNSIPLPAAALQALGDDSSPFMQALVSAWLAAGNQPLAVDLQGLGAQAAPVVQLLRESADLQRLLAHGVARPRRPQEIESFFLFLDAGTRQPGLRPAAIELMLPLLHVTWRRVASAEGTDAPSDRKGATAAVVDHGAVDRSVTLRESQILEGLRDGKTNREIALALGLSPLTVKNHVQKILRKLGASNRTQAVTQAMAGGLLASARLSEAPRG